LLFGGQRFVVFTHNYYGGLTLNKQAGFLGVLRLSIISAKTPEVDQVLSSLRGAIADIRNVMIFLVGRLV